MRINVLGGGPAGLTFAYLMKRSWPAWDVRVIEQNARDVTFGFGVVLSGRAQELIAQGDNDVVQRLAGKAETWSDQHIEHRGQTIVIDGSAFSGIARIDLLAELQAMCAASGVDVRYGERLPPEQIRISGALDADIVVGADGANSAVRDAHADAFGTRVTDLRNYFAWYGVARAYRAHTLTFKDTPEGVFCAHHYRYRPDMSTFVAEMTEATWAQAGLYAMDEDARRQTMERVFADTLGGLPLVSNRSTWRRYRIVRNDRWSHRNMVLIGDALRTAHPSIGSGTRLAMEDAIALWRAFVETGPDVTAAFARYETERRPSRERLDRAAERSIDWYERLGEKMHLAPYDFVYDYLLRTGVMTAERLARNAPQFMARRTEQHGSTVA